MVENQFTKTNTQNALSFHDGDRIFEADAVAKRSKSPNNALHYITKLFGLQNVEDENFKQERAKYYDTVAVKNYEDESGFKSKLYTLEKFNFKNIPYKEYAASDRVNEENSEFLFEEIGGMILQHASFISDKFGNTTYPDAIYTVPPWWSPIEREQLQSMGELAGINPLGFVSENTGSVMKYAFERKATEKINMLLYNMGSLSTKVSIVSLEGKDGTHFGKNITKQSVEVLAESWDSTLGAYELDLCLANFIARDFDAKFGKPTVLNNAKVMHKILRDAKKIKEILSANKVAMAQIEELAYEIDYSRKIERAEFETECKHIFDQVAKPLENALTKANLQKSEIDLVEIIGGGVRIPKVQELIKQFMDKDVSMHINGDDSMALGTSLMAANMTSTFRVMVPELTDGPNYRTDIVINGLNKEDDFNKSSVLFKERQKYGSKKLLNLKHNNDLSVTLTVPKIGKVDGDSDEGDYYKQYEIVGVQKALEVESRANYTNPTISLGFTLNHRGIPQITRAELIQEETYEVEVEKKQDTPAKEQTTTEESPKTENENSEETPKTENDSDEKETSTTESSDSEDKKTDENENKEASEGTQEKKAEEDKPAEEKPVVEKVKEQRVKKHYYQLHINTAKKYPAAYFEQEKLMKEGRSILKLFGDYEANKLKTSESKNRLEGIIYKIGELVQEDSFAKYATEAEIQDLKDTAEALDDWFFTDEAQDADFKVCDEKFKENYKKVTRIEFRRSEEELREGLIQTLYARVTQSEKNIGEMENTRPWIPKEKLQAGLEEIQEIKTWLDKKAREQEELKSNEDPVLVSKVLNAKIDSVKDKYEQLRLIKKPAVKTEGSGVPKDKQEEVNFSKKKMHIIDL